MAETKWWGVGYGRVGRWRRQGGVMETTGWGDGDDRAVLTLGCRTVLGMLRTISRYIRIADRYWLSFSGGSRSEYST